MQRFRADAIFALQVNPSKEASGALKTLSKSWCKEIKQLAQSANEKQTASRKEQS